MRRWEAMIAVVALVIAAVPTLLNAAALPPADGSPFLKERMGLPTQTPGAVGGGIGSAPGAPRPLPGPAQVQPQGGASQPPQQRASCAPPLRQGCEAQQASCRIACPPMWSTNPGAPAFTPNDRAGCTQQCLTRYLACLNLYGCS
jgi:hypothetical protein